jgi:ADP-ribosyl-[dinitrogen reductase] hydrolase
VAGYWSSGSSRPLGAASSVTALRAIVGQIAGAYYGWSGIPTQWRERVVWGEKIAETGKRLGSV